MAGANGMSSKSGPTKAKGAEGDAASKTAAAPRAAPSGPSAAGVEATRTRHLRAAHGARQEQRDYIERDKTYQKLSARYDKSAEAEYKSGSDAAKRRRIEAGHALDRRKGELERQFLVERPGSLERAQRFTARANLASRYADRRQAAGRQRQEKASKLAAQQREARLSATVPARQITQAQVAAAARRSEVGIRRAQRAAGSARDSALWKSGAARGALMAKAERREARAKRLGASAARAQRAMVTASERARFGLGR